MIRLLWIVALAALSIAAGCSHSLSPQRRSEIAALYKNCTVCHGHQKVQRGPIIDGLDAFYVEAQLQKFKSRVRGENPDHEQEQLMASVMDLLKDADEIRDISIFIGSLEPQPYRRTVVGNAGPGKTIYLEKCASCHGKKAEGKKLLKTGSLALLEDWYILNQLRQFATGLRGGHVSDEDGQRMAEAVMGMTEEQFRDVTAYIGETFGNQSN